MKNQMVIIIDKYNKPLGFTSERRAQYLLKSKRAVVYRCYPFIIKHKTLDARRCTPLEFRVKIDPGSKETGIAITDLSNNIYFKLNIIHKAQQVVNALEAKRANRRNRRNRKTRYRRCKFGKNQTAQTNRPDGWLPPSIMSIVNNILNIVKKFIKYINITECYVEGVKFDFQKLDNPNIKGIEYQQGTLAGYTVREYLLEKCRNTCQYCGGAANDKHLEVEHKISKANGGSDRIDNLTIACHTCNQAKGSRNLEQFYENCKLSTKEIDQTRVACIKNVLDNAVNGHKNCGAWVNSYRNKLISALNNMFNLVKISDGATTSYNRNKHNIPKEHYNDAACVGDDLPESFKDYTDFAYIITAKGRGKRIKGKPNCCGILNKNNIHREKTCQGFQTGDLCKIIIPKGKYKGTYIARIAIRHNGQFDFKYNGNRITTNNKNCKIVQRNDGYDYAVKAA